MKEITQIGKTEPERERERESGGGERGEHLGSSEGSVWRTEVDCTGVTLNRIT
jgi:hypothetical protein